MITIDEPKGRERSRGPAAAEATTLATKLSTAAIQPTTNTRSVKAVAQKAPVPAIATRTRTKTANTTTSANTPTTTKAPNAPKARSTITKGQKKVLHNNP
ncbi:hypothetical protein BGX30_004309, partial [Mortierella sp. GBA39]